MWLLDSPGGSVPAHPPQVEKAVELTMHWAHLPAQTPGAGLAHPNRAQDAHIPETGRHPTAGEGAPVHTPLHRPKTEAASDTLPRLSPSDFPNLKSPKAFLLFPPLCPTGDRV